MNHLNAIWYNTIELAKDTNNMENQNQKIDLSHSLDDVIEQRQQNQYTQSSNINLKNKKKKVFYFIIIIISWVVLVSISFFVWSNNRKNDKKVNEIKDKIQQIIKQNRTLPTKIR